MAKTRTHTCPDELMDQLRTFVDAAIFTHHDRTSDELLDECLVCGEWDAHTDACPVPGILAFVYPPRRVAKPVDRHRP
jgi:hypothetical protein